MLSPLLFNIFFAAAIEVVLVRFSEDTILKDLMYLKEEVGVGRGHPRGVDKDGEHYRGSVWGIWPDCVREEEIDSLDAGTG